MAIVYGVSSAVVGGGINNIASTFSFIGSGYENIININSDYSFISGGTTNKIGLPGGSCSGATLSGIGGGGGNIIDDNGAATSYGVIGGGQSNTICAGTNHSSIFSGLNNCVAGSCSSILGGNGNSDGGFPYTGIFGKGLIASVSPITMALPSAFWVDELIIPNIPVDTTPFGTGPYASLPPGALYTNVPLSSGFLASPVYVK